MDKEQKHKRIDNRIKGQRIILDVYNDRLDVLNLRSSDLQEESDKIKESFFNALSEYFRLSYNLQCIVSFPYATLDYLQFKLIIDPDSYGYVYFNINPYKEYGKKVELNVRDVKLTHNTFHILNTLMDYIKDENGDVMYVVTHITQVLKQKEQVYDNLRRIINEYENERFFIRRTIRMLRGDKYYMVGNVLYDKRRKTEAVIVSVTEQTVVFQLPDGGVNENGKNRWRKHKTSVRNMIRDNSSISILQQEDFVEMKLEQHGEVL